MLLNSHYKIDKILYKQYESSLDIIKSVQFTSAAHSITLPYQHSQSALYLQDDCCNEM
jgi:hypothetical protein